MAFRKLPGVPVSAMGLRLSQKFAFLLFLSGLVTLCLGALFFLPDSVRLKRFFLPKTTDSASTNTNTNEAATQSGAIIELAEKARADRERQERERSAPFKPEPNVKLKVSRKPSVTRGDATSGTAERATGAREERRARTPRGDATEGSTVARAKGYTYDTFRKCLLKPALGNNRGKPSDPQTVERRDKVREMMKFAWDNYRRYAWGQNELRPLTKNGHIGNMFGGLRGATIVDSLDTLYIMGLTEDYKEAKEWIHTSLDLDLERERERLEKDIAIAQTNPIIMDDFRRQETSGGMRKR